MYVLYIHLVKQVGTHDFYPGFRIPVCPQLVKPQLSVRMASPGLCIGSVGGQLRRDHRTLQRKCFPMQRHLCHHFIQRILLHIHLTPTDISILLKLKPIGIRYGCRPAGQGNFDALLIRTNLFEMKQVIDPLRISAA